MKSRSRYQRGSGCYVCRCCDHRTRDTGGDGASVGLCDPCYEVAGIENAIADGIATADDLALLEELRAAIAKRNGERGAE